MLDAVQLWLDDLRPPPEEGWHWAHTADEAIEILTDYKVSIASLDHDLGDAFIRELEMLDDGILGYRYTGWKSGDPCPKCGSDDSPMNLQNVIILDGNKFNGGDFLFLCCDITVDEYEYDRMVKEKTGYDVVKWMIENDTWPTDSIRVHSWNPVGAQRMREDIDRFGPYDIRCVYEPDSRPWTILTDE